MIIYNYKKEFLGIDKMALDAFGLANLEELRAEAGDIADLFVKTAGYVYNFEHIHWIDFIKTSMTNTSPKAIIRVRGKNFMANMEIKHMFLVDSPTAPAYYVSLSNIRQVKDSELIDATMPTPTPDTSVVPLQTEQSKVKHPYIEPTMPVSTPTPVTPVQPEPEIALDIPMQDEIIPEPPKPTPQPSIPVNDIPQDTPLEIDLDLGMDDEDEILAPTTPVEEETPTPQIQTQTDEPVLELDELVFDDEVKITPPVQPTQQVANVSNGKINPDLLNRIQTYKYDPTVACEKLGLPIELIEEFIEDFIEQAYNFKPGLYNAFEAQDMDELQSLSHKLKGVAANLHITDAFDVLATINTSKDIPVIEENLEALYMIINKLEGKNIAPSVPNILEESAETLPNELIPMEHSEDVVPDVEIEQPSQEPVKEEEDLDLLDMDDMLLTDEPQQEVQEEVTITEIPTDTYDIDDELNLELADLSMDDEVVSTPEPVKEEEKPTPTITEDDDFALSLEDLSFDDEDEPLIVEENDTTTQNISYDTTKIADEIGLDMDSFDELLEDYKSEYETISQDINSAINDGDIDTIKAQSQRLKLMSENMRMSEVITQLDKIQSSSDVDEIKSIIKNIDNFISNI